MKPVDGELKKPWPFNRVWDAVLTGGFLKKLNDIATLFETEGLPDGTFGLDDGYFDA